MAKGLHWDLCKHYGVDCEDKWYEHSPEPVVENTNVKILWNFTIQTDKKVPHNRPDIEKTNKICHIINVACLGDCRIALKENELTKLNPLALEESCNHPDCLRGIGELHGQAGKVFDRYPRWA